MKIFFFLLATLVTTSLFAQTTTSQIYGKVTKGDGSRIKGTSVMKGYEDQLMISTITGGVDNTATMEIEVPTSGYMATFRTIMNTAKSSTAPVNTIVAKPTVAIATKSTINNVALQKSTNLQPLAIFPITRIDVSLTNRTSNYMPVLTRQIILEDVIVESCTDNIASGTSKIKFKANRIGWIYINRDVSGKITTTDKSGWDTVKGQAWTNF